MANTVKLICENTGETLNVNMGTSLLEVLEMLSIKNDHPFIAAYVNNKLEELTYNVYSPYSIRYIDITDYDGMRVYHRTLFFIAQKAVYDLYPECKLKIEHSVAKGFYCEIEGMDSPSQEVVDKIKERMKTIISLSIPIVAEKILSKEAEELYAQFGFDDKISLLHTRQHLYITNHRLANLSGHFYGPLAPHTGYIHLFDLKPYYHGMYLGIPKRRSPQELEMTIPQNKMFGTFQEYKEWVKILGVSNIGSLNSLMINNKSGDLIKIAEALHEKKFANIADQIKTSYNNNGAKLILISGPSSSGKTTFSKRLGIQLRVIGFHPVPISLDDYFIEREFTPRDEKGDYDFETIDALDIELFNKDLNALLDGQEVEIPRYDFASGKRVYEGHKVKLQDNSVIVIEGIHALNPKLTHHIDQALKFKIYVSALTSVAMDNMTRIATTDNRLIRRIVRDNAYRNYSAINTIKRWESVRRGEDKHIFPFQEQADVMFNSALFFELGVLKGYVEPLLLDVPDTVPEYATACRLLQLLDSFISIPDKEIPPTSIIREFIGGSSFSY